MAFLLVLAFPFLTSSPALAQDLVVPVTVTDERVEPVRWKEVESQRILSGKKNKAVKVDLLPPMATDNHRQTFSQNAGVNALEQSTEPWPAISIRGVGDPHEAQNLMLLQDGQHTAIDIYAYGGHYFSPPTPLMEEIEVINGGGALIYGPQPGGVINYVSPRLVKDNPFKAKVGAAYGSYNLFSTTDEMRGSVGNTSYWLGYFRKQGDGYQRDNADFFAHHLQAKSHTYLENGNVLKFSFQAYDSDFGQAGGMTRDCSVANANCWDRDGDNRKPQREHDRLKISRAQLTAGLEQRLNERTSLETTLTAVTFRRYSSTQNGGGFGTLPTGTTMANRQVDAHGLHLDSRLRRDWGSDENPHTLTAGVLSYNNYSPVTSWTGQSLESIRGDVTERARVRTTVLATFAENRFNFGRWALIPGVRYENINMAAESRTNDQLSERSYNVLLGGLGATYDITDTIQSYANFSQGFKPITYTNQLRQINPLVTVKGDIKASYSYHSEAGLRSDTKHWAWDVSAYWIQYQNQIAFASNVLSNGSSAHYRGVEASVTHKDVLKNQKHALDLYANANFLDARWRGGDFEGRRPMYAPPTTVKYGTIYRHGDDWRASLLATYFSAQWADDNHTANRYIPTYQVFDLMAEKRFGAHWSVNGAVNNLLDKTYYSRIRAEGILPTMGRNFYAGANYHF